MIAASSIFAAAFLADVAMAQVFVPEFCDWPTFPPSPCVRIDFAATDSYLDWKLWSALSAEPNFAEPFVSANYFRYVKTEGNNSIGKTARAKSAWMLPSSETRSLCFRFYYFVSDSPNQVVITMKEEASDSSQISTIVWESPNYVGARVIGSWVRTHVAASVSSSSNQFYLQIEASSTSLQSAVTALARLSITFGSCFDIVEEDIIPTNAPSLPYWPSNTINLYLDETFRNGPKASSYKLRFTNIIKNSIVNVLKSIFDSLNTACTLKINAQNANAKEETSLTLIREPNENAIICAAMLGPLNGVSTEIHVTDSCFTDENYRTLLIHVIAHALGLKHQHRRKDRHEALVINDYAYDPIFQPSFDIDPSISVVDASYDLASATQVASTFLDQTGGRSPYGTMSSVRKFYFGYATHFSHSDLLSLANLLGGPNSICSVRRIDKCLAMCYNGGYCARRPNSDADTGACLCPAGFSGKSCETSTCFPPCQNGFCDPGNICNCASVSKLWTGFRCHIPVSSLCKSRTCDNGGTCILANGHETCICQPGYTGPACSSVICEQCQDYQCSPTTKCISPNRLNCSVETTGSRCEFCAAGYIGNVIQGCKPFCSSNCSGHGSCTEPEVCSCNPGWSGAKCETCIPGYEYLCYPTSPTPQKCYPPCLNYGGYCSTKGYCICYSGYEGLTCDRKILTSTTTPAWTDRTEFPTTTLPHPTTTQLDRCEPEILKNLDDSEIYVRFLLSPNEVNFDVLTTDDGTPSKERQSLEDFLNRALRAELNRFADNKFKRLSIINVCPGVIIDVLISYFTEINATIVSKIIIQQAQLIGRPLTDRKTTLNRLDFDYIPRSHLHQVNPVSVELCTVYDDLRACKNGAVCEPQSSFLSGSRVDDDVTLSPLMVVDNVTMPTCVCRHGYNGEYCDVDELPLPVWSIVAIAGGGLLVIALCSITAHMACGTGRYKNQRRNRYHRAHPPPLPPPPPAPLPGYLMVPYLQNQHNAALHSQFHHMPPIPIEPPPPYHRISFPTNEPQPPTRPNNAQASTIPRPQIRAEDLYPEDMGNGTSEGIIGDDRVPPDFGLPQPSSTLRRAGVSDVDTRSRQKKMKRPKLGRM